MPASKHKNQPKKRQPAKGVKNGKDLPKKKKSEVGKKK